MPGREVEVVCATALGEDAARWDELVLASPLPSPFLRSWWLTATADTSTRFLLVRRGRVLVGGLALRRVTVGAAEWLRLAGQGPLAPDHLDLVADPEHERLVVSSVDRWLRRPGARLLELDGIAADGHLDRLLAVLPGERRVEPVAYARLPTDPAAYLAARPGGLRTAITRGDRRLQAKGFEHRSHTGPDLERPLGSFFDLHEQRFGETSTLRRSSAVLARALRAGGRAGEVHVHELARDGKPVACEVTFDVAGRRSFYQSGRALDADARSAGTVLRWRVVADACRAGVHEYDLLRGEEAYKQQWASDTRDLVHVRSAIGLSAVAAWRLRTAAARGARFINGLVRPDPAAALAGGELDSVRRDRAPVALR